jgi:hypothetical protein
MRLLRSFRMAPAVVLGAVCLMAGCDRAREGTPAQQAEPSPGVDSADAAVRTVPLDFTDAAPYLADEIEELFEDADGAVWFALYQRPALVRITFGDATRADTIGALGNAPGQFRMPFTVMQGTGGQVMTLDGVARRLVGFTMAGAAGDVIDVPESVDQFTTRRDTLGAWVSLLGQRARNDSAPLVRVRDDRTDTLAFVHVPAATVSIPMGPRTYVAAPEFAPRDLWGVLADGTVWIARGGRHAVEYVRADGTRVLAGPRAFTPIPSTDADRGTLRGLPAPKDVPVSALQYAPVKGPFLEARGAADGAVWTWRTQRAPATDERYTVFALGVAETFDVVLPAHHRVVGVGAKAVYVAERLDDGRSRVTRHPRPR